MLSFPNNSLTSDPAIGQGRRRKRSVLTNALTLERIPGLILLIVQNCGSKALRSGDLAKAAGVSPDTIRHYERIGILPRASRTESGYRVYPASTVERVLVVQRALRIGFTLAELAEVLKARDAGGAPCHRVYQLAHEKLRGIEADIEDLESRQRYMKKVLSDWEQRIQRAGPGQKSHVALGVYAFDCEAATTPEKAMQCCKSMHCSSRGRHGQNCCKTMPTMHTPFVQPPSVHGVSFSPVVLAVMAASCKSSGLDSFARAVAAHCHAPPSFHSTAAPPLRI
jgi:DNA-binding transcriptional MerR regulator